MSANLWIDIESTGLGDNSAVIELAAIAVIDDEVKHHFQSYIRPHEGATLDPKAFEVNKIDIKKIWDFPNAETVIQDFLSYVDSFERTFTLSGHNVSFDIKKLHKLFNRYGRYGDYVFRFRPGGIDTLSYAKTVLKGTRNQPKSFSLEKLCEHFKIELGNAHSALPDIKATIELYNHLRAIRALKVEAKDVSLPYLEKRRKLMDMNYVQINPEGSIFLSENIQDLSRSDREFIVTEIWDYLCGHLDTTFLALDQNSPKDT